MVARLRGLAAGERALIVQSNTVAGGTVVCYLGSISNGATATATITVIAGNITGTIVNTATVSTASTDLNLAESTTVNSVGVTASDFKLQATNMAGGLQLTLVQGQGGQLYTIQVSSNLLSWKSVFTNTASLNNGSFIYTDPNTNAPERYYRAVHSPQ